MLRGAKTNLLGMKSGSTMGAAYSEFAPSWLDPSFGSNFKEYVDD
jgi:hypothetical protein